MDPVLWSSEREEERALLIGAQRHSEDAWHVEDSMDELEQLAATAGARVLLRMVCRVDRPNPSTYIGSGKAEEIAAWIEEHQPTLVIFDDDLTPAQGRNLEELFKVRVIDRTQMILDIFAKHAQTREGCLQIELAQLEYLMPRLRRMWTHLERQQGGIGMRGPGETQLESDRRRILQKIARLKKELEQVRRHRTELRRGRRRHGWALASLVGYTNAGKSTLLNALTGSEVKAYDQLFATLDPTTRQINLPNHQSVLLTDTVGFIRKLPHGLVESFKATLEEIVESDLLIHVIDTSHPQVDAQIQAVQKVLNELGAGDKKILSVLNKIDLPQGKSQATRLLNHLGNGVALSAHTGEGLPAFLDALCDQLRDRHVRLKLRIPVREGKVIAELRSTAQVVSERYEGEFMWVEAYVPKRLSGRLNRFVKSETPP